MKTYILVKKKLMKLPVKVIEYGFNIKKTIKPTKYTRLIVHNTGEKCNTIQKIIDLHIKKNKWSAIGYHFLIGKRGQIYYSRDLKYAGAHTFGYNRNSIGIALFGNFDDDEPTQKQIDSLKRLINTLSGKYTLRDILGHNEAIYSLLKEKYWKLNLPDVNLLDIETKLSYDAFQKDITTKILETDASKITVDLVKKFKTCPGFNIYKPLREIKIQFKKTYSTNKTNAFSS